MRKESAVAIAIFVIAASHAGAAIRVTRDGESVHDAELCYYAAAGTENPFAQQFASQKVICSSALPQGLWNVYARQENRFISPRVVLVDSRKTIPDIELRLEPAATIELPAGGIVYLTDTVSVFPGEVVPAERDLLPLLIENRKIRGIGSIVHLKIGENSRFDSFVPQALITWLSIAPADLQAVHIARKPRPPQIVDRFGPRRSAR